VSGNNSDTCHRVRALPNEPSSAKERKWNAKEANKKQKQERGRKKNRRKKERRKKKEDEK